MTFDLTPPSLPSSIDLQVHHMLNELYGGFVLTKYVSRTLQPPPSKVTRLEGGASVHQPGSVPDAQEAEGGGGEEPPVAGSIEIRIKRSRRRVERGSDSDAKKNLITKFVLRKRNSVSIVCCALRVMYIHTYLLCCV